jgi:ATP-dependent DNA helicase RecG
MNLLNQIQRGESKTLELKSELPKHDQIAKTIIAFANTSGGKLIIGVNDNRQIVGIDESDILTLQDRLSSILFDRCYPAILPEIYSANLEGKLVLIVEIFRGNLLPYHLKSEGKNNGTYLRIGATNRKADFDHILELERQKRNLSFDEEACREINLSALDLAPLRLRFAKQGKILDEEKLQNLRLTKQEQGTLYPTQGLMILLGQYPHIVIKCARFKGTDMSLFLDRKEYDGNLFTQLEQVEAFIKNHIHLRGEIKGLQRRDTFEIPEEALREALINAIIHRDYTNQGRDIKVGIYDNIVNIVSPGGFPSTLTADSLLDGRSEIRNRVIARVFKELGYIEQWGSGIQRIRAACLAQGLTVPRIEEQGDFVGVEFDRQTSLPDSATKVPDNATKVPDNAIKVPDSLTSQESDVISHIDQQGSITAADVERLLSVKERRARKVIQDMIQKGLLEKRGGSRSTFYVRAR